MARKKVTPQTEEPDSELLDHIHGLGLGTVEEYRRWCIQNGFSKRLKKQWKQRCRERFHVQESAVRRRLHQKKREKRKFIDVITGICDRQLVAADVTQPHLKRLCELVRNDQQVNRRTFRCLLARLYACRAKFFDGSPVNADIGECPGNTFIEALALVASHSRSWVRPVEDWKPRSHSSRRQFTSLLRHLFVKYDDMPLFFDAVWFAGRTKGAAERRSWYLHVGRGESIRTCNLPILFTKRMAHHFMHAPSDVNVDQALRWAQVRGLGGDERLARAIFGTRLIDNFKHHAFWTTVIRWFASHSMLDAAQVGPIIDYLHHQRFVPVRVLGALGNREESPPPQPRLSMKGRTPVSLLDKVNAWHRKLANDNTQQVRQWNPSGIEGFEFLEGSQKNENLKYWTIRELLCSKALIVEGRQLKHCVATYAPSCARGHCSIWTMEVETCEGQTKAITIEVAVSGRLIRQARGKANRLPNEKEKNLIRRWAAAKGLRVANTI